MFWYPAGYKSVRSLSRAGFAPLYLVSKATLSGKPGPWQAARKRRWPNTGSPAMSMDLTWLRALEATCLANDGRASEASKILEELNRIRASWIFRKSRRSLSGVGASRGRELHNAAHSGRRSEARFAPQRPALPASA